MLSVCYRYSLILVTALTLTGGCAETRTDESQSRELLPTNAIIILLDTLRADHLSSYGYPKPTTPALDALAEKGVRFQQVVSASPWTQPSVSAILSANHPELVSAKNGYLLRSLIEDFAQAGFLTAAVTEGGFVSRYFGFDRGFEFYHEEEGAVRLVVDGKHFNKNATGGINTTFKIAKDWLQENGKSPFLMFIHTYETHTPYTNKYFVNGLNPGRMGSVFEISQLEFIRKGQLVLTPKEKQYIHALYESDIYSADRHVGQFLEFLEKSGLQQDTIVIVTSDHGEELGQHSELNIYDHGHSLHDNQLMVPLIIYDPTRTFSLKLVTSQVRTIDILPTVADLLDVKIEDPVAGRSLVPLMTAEETSDRLAFSGRTKLGPPRFSLRDGRYKFIRVITNGQNSSSRSASFNAQLYDLLNDPAEKVNLISSKPKLASALTLELQHHLDVLAGKRTDPQSQIKDKALLERLRSLGYLK